MTTKNIKKVVTKNKLQKRIDDFLLSQNRKGVGDKEIEQVINTVFIVSITQAVNELKERNRLNEYDRLLAKLQIKDSNEINVSEILTIFESENNRDDLADKLITKNIVNFLNELEGIEEEIKK